MKKLIKLKFKHYLYFSTTILLLMGTIIFVSFLKIESSFKTNLIAHSYKPVFIISNSDIYKVKKNQKVSIKVNNEYFYVKIKSIEYDNTHKIYKLKVTDIPLQMVPGSTLEAKIIYKKVELYKKILQ